MQVLQIARKKLRSSAEGTLAHSGRVVHQGAAPSRDNKQLTEHELAILERRASRLQRRLEKIKEGSGLAGQVGQECSTSGFGGAEQQPIGDRHSALARTAGPRPIAGDGRPAPMCRHCGGLTSFASRATWCGAVEKAEERWRCLDEDCAGFEDMAVCAFPLREYDRRG